MHGNDARGAFLVYDIALSEVRMGLPAEAAALVPFLCVLVVRSRPPPPPAAQRRGGEAGNECLCAVPMLVSRGPTASEQQRHASAPLNVRRGWCW